MDKQEKLQYLVDHSSELSQDEWSMLIHLYRRVRSVAEAREEKDDIVKDALFSQSDLLSTKLKLSELQKSLGRYVRDKGLSRSLLQVDELLNMIHNDMNTTDDQKANLNYIVRELQKRAAEQNSAKEETPKEEIPKEETP